MAETSRICNPEMALSMQLGTSVCSCNGPCGTLVKLLEFPADCHVQIPLSVCQLSRFNCGRGCSGHGFRPTLFVHGVSSGGVLSWYAAAVVVAAPMADVVVLVNGVVVATVAVELLLGGI